MIVYLTRYFIKLLMLRYLIANFIYAFNNCQARVIYNRRLAHNWINQK